MIQVSDRGEDGSVAKLLGDDADVEPFLAELRRVGVAEAVGVDTFGDAREPGQRGQQAADVGGGKRVAVPGTEDRRAVVA